MMNASLERDDSRRRLRITVEGPLSLAALLPLVRHLREPELLDYAVLWDMRDTTIESRRFSLVSVRDAILSLDRGRPRPGPVALLVRGEAALSLGRAVVLLGSAAGYRVKAFRDLQAAEGWLDQSSSSAG